jgi:octaprenyl-diphosphate synthase
MNLEEIYNPIKGELVLVEKEIKLQIDLIIGSQSRKNREYINRVVSYLFEVPGKLLRPSLVLLSAKAVGDVDLSNVQQLIKLAAAVEFVHTASLIHDDIIDESRHRRHQVTLNRQFGNKVAVLVGDIFYSQFFSLLISLEFKLDQRREKLLRIFNETTKRLCFGEIYEHKIRENRENPSFKEYLEVIENKTASLFSVSCAGGSMLNGADESLTTAMANYGLYLGLAFQIVDDFIDNDSIFRSDGSMIAKAGEYSNMAKAEMKILPESPVKGTLSSMLDFIMARAKAKGSK